MSPRLLSATASVAALCLAACSTPAAPPAVNAGAISYAAALPPLGQSGRPDPDMQAVLDALTVLGARPIETLSVEEARLQASPADAVKQVKTMRGLSTAPDPTVATQDLTYPTADGLQAVRVYKPVNGGAKPLPVIVYFHGGGWVIANLDVYDATPRSMARNLNAIVVSVDYRQGPEHRFPAAHEDANSAYQWVLREATNWGGDLSRLAVAGESAGGNLAMNVAIAARDAGWATPRHVLAVYPIANADPQLASKRLNTASMPLRTATLAWFGEYALRGPSDQRDPRYNLVGAELGGLPPVTIVNAEIDPLNSDGETLANALRAAGVPVEHQVWAGAVHEFFSMADVVRDAYDAQQWSFARLRADLQ